MPKYTYECLSCEHVFEHRHGMTETLENCIKCSSENIEKRVSDFTLEKNQQGESKNPVGSEVKKFIESTKKEIKEERKNLSSRIVE